MAFVTNKKLNIKQTNKQNSPWGWLYPVFVKKLFLLDSDEENKYTEY